MSTEQKLQELLVLTNEEIDGDLILPEEEDYHLILKQKKIEFCLECIKFDKTDNITYIELVEELL